MPRYNMDYELQKFQSQLVKFTSDLTEKAGELATKKVAMDVLAAVVMETPVDTGRARGNWQASVSSPASSPTNKKDKDGETTVHSETFKIDGMSVPQGQTIWITNNVPYIERLEAGHSTTKAPDGIVAPALHSVRRGSFGTFGGPNA